ncbi:TPA: hypothetical protein N0F65_006468 [Lagenidium giganteum]|uniref:Palmitoyltransferase n=1 Tax=Lagenidium giganteum TaxID=4803 RepID=A0AAV2YHY9_9STRA|nr:TPA: hypothetical protein N0F65_006468 [Lagenidium giganteum]
MRADMAALPYPTAPRTSSEHVDEDARASIDSGRITSRADLLEVGQRDDDDDDVHAAEWRVLTQYDVCGRGHVEIVHLRRANFGFRWRSCRHADFQPVPRWKGDVSAGDAAPSWVVGPHWWLMMLTFAVFLLAAVMVSVLTVPRAGVGEALTGMILSGACLAMYAMVGCTNPGIVPRIETPPSDTFTYCDHCASYRPPGALHCMDCRACIEEYDHHCPWTGKCVGKRNLRYFYAWLLFLVLAFVYEIIEFTTYLLPPEDQFSSPDASNDQLAHSRIPLPSLSTHSPHSFTMIAPRLLLASAALLAVATDSASAATTCKAMSFNLRTSNANDAGKGSWDNRKAHAKEVLANMTTSKANSGYQLIGECAGECNANERTFIMYDASKWKVIDSGDFALSDKPSQLGSNTWGLAYNRAATWGRFQHKTSGDNVCFVNTHYDMSLGQQKSSELIAKQMASICKEGDLAMLTGDLNTVPNSGPVKYLVGSSSPFQLTNTLELAGVSGGTFIGNGVFTGKLSSTVFDYVLAKSSQLCVQEGEVIDERFDGTAISDHALVMSTFCLGSGCSDCKKGQKLSSSGDIGRSAMAAAGAVVNAIFGSYDLRNAKQWRDEDIAHREQEIQWLNDDIVREHEWRNADIERFLRKERLENEHLLCEARAEQLSTVSEQCALLFGFTVAAMSNLNIPEHQNETVLFLYAVSATIVCSLLLMTMVMCAMLLLAVTRYAAHTLEDEVRNLDISLIETESPFSAWWLKRCEMEQMMAYKLMGSGLLMFFFYMAFMSWIQFHEYTYTPASVTSLCFIGLLFWQLRIASRWRYLLKPPSHTSVSFRASYMRQSFQTPPLSTVTLRKYSYNSQPNSPAQAKTLSPTTPYRADP